MVLFVGWLLGMVGDLCRWLVWVMSFTFGIPSGGKFRERAMFYGREIPVLIANQRFIKSVKVLRP